MLWLLSMASTVTRASKVASFAAFAADRTSLPAILTVTLAGSRVTPSGEPVDLEDDLE